MARKQQTLPGNGFKRDEIPAVQEAAEKYREARDERMELTKRETATKLALIATMQAHKVERYKFDDSEGEELMVSLDESWNVKVRKTGEAADQPGSAVENPDGSVPQGLLDQAAEKDGSWTAGMSNGTAQVTAPSSPKKKAGRPKKDKAPS